MFHLECSARLVENLHPSIQVPASSEPPKQEQEQKDEQEYKDVNVAQSRKYKKVLRRSAYPITSNVPIEYIRVPEMYTFVPACFDSV